VHDKAHLLELLEERERRKKEKQSSENTVYGIVCPDKGLLYCLQDQGGEYVKVDKDPVVNIPAKAERFVTIPKPIKVLKGGRGSGKSETIGSVVDAKVKDYGKKALCFRELQNTINDSVHSMLERKIAEHGFTGFNVLDSKIDHENGGKIRYRGVSRNPDGVKSYDGFDIGWGEEAQSLSAKSIDMLEPTFREQGSEIYYSLNPGSSMDPIAVEHLKPYETELLKDGYYEDDQIMIIELNYRDNPWFPEVLDVKRKKNKLIWPANKYENIWEGKFNDEVENSIIPTEWFDAAIDAHVKQGWEMLGKKVYAHDPSDTGDDDKGFAFRHGSVLLECESKTMPEYIDGVRYATGRAIELEADDFVWDGDGMGAIMRRDIAKYFRGKKIRQEMYKGSEGVKNPEAIYQPVDDESARPRSNKHTFKNRRAQEYISLRDRFYNTYMAVVHGIYCDPEKMISISSSIKHINKLRAELCRIPLKPNGNGLIQIMSKDEMMRLLKLPSPNMADSVKMAYSVTNVAPKNDIVMPKPQRPVYGSSRHY
jgi:phage terminase large subunit